MKTVWKIIRTLVTVLLLVAVVVPASLYVLLSVDSVQNLIRDTTCRELSDLLGARVSIGHIGIRPFTKISLSNMALVDSTGTDTVATVSRVSAGIEPWELLRKGRIVVDYALAEDVNINVWRADSASELNISPILAHLRNDDEQNREKSFDLRINTVIIRNASASYNVLAAAETPDGLFDPNHISVSDIALNAYIPQISNRRYAVELDHLSAREHSGLEIRKVSANVDFDFDEASITNLSILLPHTTVAFEPIHISFADGRRLTDEPISLKTKPGCEIYPPDIAAVAPVAADFDRSFSFELDADACRKKIDLRRLALRVGNGSHFAFFLSGMVRNIDSINALEYRTDRCTMLFDGAEMADMFAGVIPLKTRNILEQLPLTALTITADGSLDEGRASLRTDGEAGLLTFDGNYNRRGRVTSLDGLITFDEFNAGLFADNGMIGLVSGEAHGNVSAGRNIVANVNADIRRIDLNGYSYSGLRASLDMPRAERMEATVNLNDPNITALVYAFYDKTGDVPALSATATVANADFTALNLPGAIEGYDFGAKMIAELKGTSIDDIDGTLSLTDVRWLDSRNHGLRLPRLSISAAPHAETPAITITSDLINGSIEGEYTLSKLPAELKIMAANYLPALFNADIANADGDGHNNFNFNLTLESMEKLSRFFNLPAAIVYPATVSGEINSRAGRALLRLNAPYIRQGDKIYDHTTLTARIDSLSDLGKVYFTTHFPTKKGDMAVSTEIKAFDNRVDTRVDWTIERRLPLAGTIDFSTLLRPADEVRPGQKALSPIGATINFNPGTVNFGYETWQIMPSVIDLDSERISVEHFAISSDDQHVAIDGTVSHEENDSIDINIAQLSLLPIFETLEIDKAMLSGRATGHFKASGLLSTAPTLQCSNLHVDSIGYNRCTIGDADIAAGWDNERKAFYLDADITGDRGDSSRIAGYIFPFDEALDLDFQAGNVPVGFLKPFMDAFARDIHGRATGHCRLFGTFKEIDLTGDVYADNISIDVDFTNTVYSASDSVHMRPGEIIIPETTIYDTYGHTARMKGRVGHTFFKQPVFRFDVSDARNFLAFNGTPKQNPDWYGSIFGNGTASVSGEPGVVNIEADMSTGPGSTFTFVLSDRLDAEEYSFITFRDATPADMRHSSGINDDIPLIVRELQNRITSENEDEPSAYKMKISVDLTKDAELTLVMDPATDDEIKATGTGHVTMSYNSVDEDLRIYGAYSVMDGSYHFTLQDIIIKDFTIKEGSTINFDGDPYAVRADLHAYYATNANLSDLDESFLQDREVARTNVPVHALMNVRGDIRQPEISFDLEFPTLTDDTYRKVRSIVSTNDMMNRQIIYLLALNRFYTPDYMSSTTKGSELFSVASSTISSQLGSLLGKLSDNWSIAPNLRSDRGDFSDVEVDVALSSRLLNNRLLFNGNFGYRDKSLNSNQFIGDFDIEYLLNKRGSWRLKAYNRYNDANYYLRSAATTQGVGIMYRRDFDNIFSFLRKKKKRNVSEETSAPADSTSHTGAE